MNRFPILNTKLYKPDVKAHYVFRKEIVENLEHHRDKPLTLVVAATGYGKSVTISEWLDYSKAKHCWVTLDDELNEPRSYLISVQGKLPEIIIDNFEGIEKFTVMETNKSIITLITIKIKDQAHLSGLMNTLYD